MERFIMYYFTVDCHNLLLFQYNIIKLIINTIKIIVVGFGRQRSPARRIPTPELIILINAIIFQFQTWNRVPFPPPPPETPCQNRCTSCPAVVAVARCPSCHQSRVISRVNRNCIRDSSLLLAAKTTPTIATLRCKRTCRPRSFPRRT